MAPDGVTVERAGRSPDELALLAGIAGRPADDLGRLATADWLDERDDPRGAVLRAFTARTADGLPPLDGVPTPWADLTGLTVLSAVARAGLWDRRHQLLAHARPALRIDADPADFENPPPTPAALGTTRLGGDPDLPAGADYPADHDGVPFHFLGQFDLADFAGTVAGRSFPPAGLLSIFRPQSDGKNCYPTAADCPRLVRLSTPGTPLNRLPRPTGLTDPPAPFRPGLRLAETLRLPGMLDTWTGYKMTDEEASRFDALFPTNLGGEVFHLLGHATHGNTGDEPLKDRPDWVQLILVPHSEGPDYGQSDMSLSYHLPAADLAAGRFVRLEATFG